MAEQTLQINQPDKAPGAPTPDKVVEHVKTDTSALAKAQATVPAAVKEQTKSTQDARPGNWSIFPTEEDGVIEARNNFTGNTFKGTVAEFNQTYFR